MATNLQKLENALINADKAGDTVAAKQLANEIKMLQQQEQADLAKLEESIERLPKAPRPSRCFRICWPCRITWSSTKRYQLYDGQRHFSSTPIYDGCASTSISRHYELD